MKTVSRLILFVGVLVGICVSSGEGIRLLPFPPSDLGAAAVNGDQIGDGRANFYAQTVRNSAAPSVVAKFKTKDHHKLGGRAVAISEKLQRVAVRAKSASDNYSNAAFCTASGPISQPTDRGPPA